MKVRRFFIKLLIFSLPFIAVILLYIWLDPFKVVRPYPQYFTSGRPSYISLNKDHISTENWINHYPQFHYNSYILGNSRSIFYQVDSWRNYIGQPHEKCYHFDASGESIYGIARKIQFLYDQGSEIKNCLVVMDNEALNQAKNSAGHLFLKDPHISGESSFAFQVESIKAFFDFKFLTSYLDFKISGQVKDYMKKEFLLDDRPFYYDYVTNEMQAKIFEELIHKNPSAYYEPRKGLFYSRDTATQKIADSVIRADQVALLEGMKKVFTEKGTNYKIVISPLYNQLKLNPVDLAKLQRIFGEDHVYDFSGINSLTRDVHHYYETSHYRPEIADQVMKMVYSGPPVKQGRN